LLFLFIEQSDNAINRIYSITETAKLENLDVNYNALSKVAGYYSCSTIYRLLAPF